MNEISEKRKYKRIEKQYIARFRIKPDEAQDMDSKDWDGIALNDIGAGGIYFHVRRNLEVGTIMDLKINFYTSIPPVDISITPIECRGVVLRVKEHPDFPVFGIATEFTEIDEYIKEVINISAPFVKPDNQFLYNKEQD